MPDPRPSSTLTIAVMALLCIPILAYGQGPELRPVWHMVVENDVPRITHNEFQTESPDTFPLGQLVVRKAFRLEGDHRDRVFVSLLELRLDGSVEEMTPFVTATAAPGGSWGRGIRLLVPPDGKSPPPAHSDYIPADRVLEHATNMGLWFLSPDGGLGIANDIGSAVVFDVHELRIIQRLAGLAIDVSFARNSPVFAAIVVVDGEDKTRGHRLLLTLDRDAGVLHEKWVPDTVGDLHVSNDGTYAVVSVFDAESATIANDNIDGVELSTGRVSVLLEDVGGIRCHSADGSRMVVVQGGWSKILFFNTEDIRHPYLIWTYETEGTLVSPAINDDGTRIAFIRARSLGAPVTAEILDDNMKIVGRFPKPDEMSIALMFAGGYLFAGVQPGRGIQEWQTTGEIAVYRVP